MPPSTTYDPVPEWLRATRERHDWTQDVFLNELRAATGWAPHRPNYSRYETGKATPKRAKYLVNGLSLAAFALFVLAIALRPNVDSDTHAYWTAWHSGLYAGHWPLAGAYIYSPAFAQIVLWPLAQLPFEIYWQVQLAIQAFLLIAVLRPPLALAVLVLPWWPFASYLNPVHGSLQSGNIDIALGAIVVLGLRYPVLWSVAILTKVTPGIGVLWFALRREWRKAAAALGATAVISAVSFTLAPGLWFDWLTALRSSGDAPAALIPWGLPIRLPLAAGIIAVGAWRGWTWTVPLGAGLALPQLGYGSYAVMVIGVLGSHLRYQDLLDVRVRVRAGRLVAVHDEVRAL